MRYREVLPIERELAESVFQSGDALAICDALVRATFHSDDWRWVQDQCVSFITHESVEVRGLAATCLGHLARIHRELDLGKVIPALEELRLDVDVGGRAADALDDIRTFLGTREQEQR